MSALVIDTSSWISYFAGRGSSAVDEALAEGRAHLSLVVAAELTSAPMSARDRLALEDLMGDLPLCPNGLDHWLRVGRLRCALRSKGLSVSTPDAHVAQCAIDLEGELLTEDRIFGLIARHGPLRLV